MSTGVSSRVSSIFLNSLLKSNEVSFRLRHLVALYIDVAVAVVSSRPKLFILPDSCVVEQGHSQMILDQILGRTTEVQWIPIQE